jgi:hypothetical protein
MSAADKIIAGLGEAAATSTPREIRLTKIWSTTSASPRATSRRTSC